MTPARAKRLARLARAQRALAELSARENARLNEAHAASEAAEGAIIGALNADSPLHGLLTETMADALTRNAVTTYRLAREVEAAADVQRHETVRADAFERRAADARRLLGRIASRRELEALLGAGPNA